MDDRALRVGNKTESERIMKTAPIALQLYTVRDVLADDFAGTLKKIADIGYAGVELAGSAGYSAQELRTMIGDPTPDFTYGFSLGTNYKGFFIDADFYGVYGNEVYRGWGNGNSFAPFNYREERMDRWTGPGTSNWEPRSYTATGYNREISSYMIEDGSFFRIRNVQMGYSFNKNFLEGISLEALKVYINVQNLKTWDHVNGFTPEAGGNATSFGINAGGYPNPRIASFGINATF